MGRRPRTEDLAFLRARGKLLPWRNLQHGVELVWLILPSTREVIVIGRASELRCSMDQQLVEHPSLPALQPRVSELFAPLERR